MKVLGGEGREKTREASWNERGKKKRLRRRFDDSVFARRVPGGLVNGC